MSRMFVTLDVSKLMFVTLNVLKLTGWLNAVAYCRVERQACDARRGAGWGA